jgi:Porphyromonas-type peptidyl-arginine deiminase
MGWPDSGNLWRENAKPAQEQYAAIAIAISQFEPLTMFANPGEVRATGILSMATKHGPNALFCLPTLVTCVQWGSYQCLPNEDTVSCSATLAPDCRCSPPRSPAHTSPTHPT